jgi:Rps23 Pro-64 3,4-dihydroxylase Tpa1-like proline 4-hydroxylase
MCGKCFARADYLSKHLTTHIHSSQRWISYLYSSNSQWILYPRN